MGASVRGHVVEVDGPDHTYRRDPDGVSPLGIWDDGEDWAPSSVFGVGRLKTGAAREEHFLLVAFGMARNLGYPTDGLLRFMARPRFNLLLNPTANRYLIGEYRWPAKLARTGLDQGRAAGPAPVGRPDPKWAIVPLPDGLLLPHSAR